MTDQIENVEEAEADRLIAAALRDHARIAAPAPLRRRLERRYGRTRRRWIAPAAIGAVVSAALTIAIMMIARPTAPPPIDLATEAAGDHLRVLVGRDLGVAVSDMHQVKPWFAGKLDFVPPVTFLGDDEFALRGGDVAVFLGHRAAVFVYARKRHVISLFVFDAADAAPERADERTIQGFHVLTWRADGFGFALVSDVNWDDLRALHDRLK